MRPQVSQCVNDGSNNLNQETLLEDSLQSGRPSSVPLKVLKAMVEENPKQTARELAKQFSTCQQREL